MTTADARQGLLDAAELAAIEQSHADGISSQAVIALFTERGVRLSEATFRKYVQLGLLPTSRRVGRKGKHRGSRGVYPVSVVRRINLIKRLMDEGMTLEEIRDSFISIQNDIEQIRDAFEALFGHVGDRVGRLEAAGRAMQPLQRDVRATRKDARSLLNKIEKLSSRLAVAGPISAEQE